MDKKANKKVAGFVTISFAVLCLCNMLSDYALK